MNYQGNVRAARKIIMDRVTGETHRRTVFQYYPFEQLGEAKDFLSLIESGVAKPEWLCRLPT